MRYLIFLIAYMLVMLGINICAHYWGSWLFTPWEWAAICGFVAVVMSYFFLWDRS